MVATEIAVNTLIIGAIYALGAAGLTILYGVSGILNLAHGGILVAAALVTWHCSTGLGLSLLTSALLGIATSIALTFCIYGIAIRPLMRSTVIKAHDRPIYIFVATLLVALILEGVLNAIFGASPVATPPFLQGVAHLGPVTVPLNNILIVAVTWLVLGFLWVLTTFTTFGKAMIAASMSTRGLAMLGYNLPRLNLGIWTTYAVLTGTAGVLLGSFLGASSSVAISMTVISFTVVVIGGLGSVVGSLVGAYLLGFTETLTAYLISPAVRNIPAFILLIAFLYFRPLGLLGRH